MSTTYQPPLPASITGLIPHALSIADTGFMNRRVMRILNLITIPTQSASHESTSHESTLQAEN